jgi:hypothetical protein
MAITYHIERETMEGYVTFAEEPLVGVRVSYFEIGRTDGNEWKARGSGIFVGIARDEEERTPYFYFVDGEINGTPQRSHGFPAPYTFTVTTDRTPTELISDALTERGIA